MKIHGMIAVLLLLSACADPLANVERLGEVDLPAGATVASALSGPTEAADAPLVLDQLLDQDDATRSVATSSAADPMPPRRGFWSLFGAAAEPGEEAVVAAAAGAGAAAVSVPASAAPTSSMATGPDAQQVTLGTALPYGQIGTVCGQPVSALGTRIAASAGYDLYDSTPNQTALRVHYLTGFPDGCARIFSAALVLFGDVGTHELVRYLPSNAAMPYSGTDAAYEQVKAQFCGVPTGQTCGRKLDRLAAHSTFVTIYETFGTNPEWGEIFVHQGQVMAIDVRRG